ncbi:MAG TPA: DMT family transporter [Candidatus Polarisedimenticolaceae bacterium]|nr:DMT family transporter [Candidatus Polarisedimenticolaceae bacterium]
MSPRLGALAAIVMWGVSFVATKAVLAQISPVTLIFTRFGLGLAVLLALLAWRGEPLLPPRDAWRSLAGMGLIGVFVHQLLQAHALTTTTAVHTGWLIGLTPIWSAILAALFLGERLRPGRVGGILVGFVGAVLVVTRGRLGAETLALPTARGDLLILASTLNWAVYSVLGHGTLKRLGARRATAGAMLAGWALLVPLFAWTGGWREYPALDALGWSALLFLGIGCSALGYLLWYGALERVEATRVAALLYLEPLVTLAAAVALLGERVELSTVAGGALVLAGVLIVQRSR